MKLRNVSPLGHLDFPLVGRVLKPGEEFDVDDEVAGRAPSLTVDDGVETFDPGEGLLAQVGNFERADLVHPKPDATWRKADLLAHARAAGITADVVDDSATKAEILDAIEAVPSTSEEIQ